MIYLPKLKDRPHTLYLLRNAIDDPLYVGITWNLAQRLRQHELSKEWWSWVASMVVTPYPDRHHALRAERHVIGFTFPEYNIHPGDYGDSVLPAPGHRRLSCSLCDRLDADERRLALWAAELCEDNETTVTHLPMSDTYRRWIAENEESTREAHAAPADTSTASAVNDK